MNINKELELKAFMGLSKFYYYLIKEAREENNHDLLIELIHERDEILNNPEYRSMRIQSYIKDNDFDGGRA